eukprot:11313715-Alexandrium_andersonii.AAC.1
MSASLVGSEMCIRDRGEGCHQRSFCREEAQKGPAGADPAGFARGGVCDLQFRAPEWAGGLRVGPLGAGVGANLGRASAHASGSCDVAWPMLHLSL